MAATDYAIGHMLKAELDYVGDRSITKVYVPRKILLDAIPTEVLRDVIEEREATDA